MEHLSNAQITPVNKLGQALARGLWQGQDPAEAHERGCRPSVGDGQVRGGFLEEVMGKLKDELEPVREEGKSALGRVEGLEQ